MAELGIRILLRQLRDDPDPMQRRLMEMYREWCRDNGIRPSSGRGQRRAPLGRRALTSQIPN